MAQKTLTTERAAQIEHAAYERAAAERRDARELAGDDWRGIRGGFDVTLRDGYDGEMIAVLPNPACSACILTRRVTLADFAALSAIADSTTYGLRDTRGEVA